MQSTLKEINQLSIFRTNVKPQRTIWENKAVKQQSHDHYQKVCSSTENDQVTNCAHCEDFQDQRPHALSWSSCWVPGPTVANLHAPFPFPTHTFTSALSPMLPASCMCCSGRTCRWCMVAALPVAHTAQHHQEKGMQVVVWQKGRHLVVTDGSPHPTANPEDFLVYSLLMKWHVNLMHKSKPSQWYCLTERKQLASALVFFV